MAELTLGSLFDGLGGWQLAALHNGVRPVWSSEIEAFPMAVTKKHFPDTLQLGDINRLNGAEIPPVDIICAGSPCQGLSISGKKKGLNDERSGLFRQAINIVREMRNSTNGEFPKFFIWENVPGAFSTNDRHDFKAVLQEITETEIPMPASGRWAEAGMVRSRKCDVAWRVLDAQYWGVPQRRKRIFLIADFRNQQSRNTEVLFEPESVPRNPASGENEGQGTAAGAENDIRATSSFEPGITAREGRKLSEEVSTTLRANMGDNQTTVLTASFYPNNSEKARGIDYDVRFTSEGTRNARRHVYKTDTSRTLDTATQNPDSNHGGAAVVENKHCEAYAVHENQQSCITLKPVANAMSTGGGKPGQGYPCTMQPQQQVYSIAGNIIDRQLKNGANGKGVSKDISYTLNTVDRHAVTDKEQYAVDFGRTADRIQMNATQSTTLLGLGGGGGAKTGLYHLKNKGGIKYIVRRLTPVEAERLQGLPDNFTNVECNGKPASDSARYKAIGNGMAQPCADFVLNKVVQALRC